MTAEVILPALAISSRAADPGAFDAFVIAHQRIVFRLALRMLGDVDEAANAAQDCFLKAFLAFDRCPREIAAQGFWIRRLAVNLCLDRLRSRRWNWWRRRLGLDADAARQPSEAVRSPERELLARELAGRMQLSLRRLTPRQRAVFVMRHYDDCSIEQIATALGMRPGTVKSHLNRALTALREELKEFYDPPSSRF